MVGKLSFDTLMSAIKSFYIEHPTLNVLWDFREATLSSIFSQDVLRIVKWVKRNSDACKGGKTVWVVSKPTDFGVLRMMSTHCEIEQFPFALNIFYSMEEAMQWIKNSE